MNLVELGTKCKELREQLGYFQSDVADEIGYSKETISSFECGRNNNATILFWYIQHGLNINEGGVENEGI